MGVEHQAANIRAPFDRAGDDDYDVRLFDATTSHQAHAVPKEWKGKYVDVRVITSGGQLWFGFSKSSTAEVDRSVAATAAGASTKVGRYISDGDGPRPFLLPDARGDETVYFVREAASTVTVELALSDEQHREDNA